MFYNEAVYESFVNAWRIGGSKMYSRIARARSVRHFDDLTHGKTEGLLAHRFILRLLPSPVAHLAAK